MDLLNNIILGFSVALTLQNVGYAFVGCLLGTVIGVLPGLGPVATIAMLLPITYTLSPVTALIMLAGIYYGAQYGGSTTAILMNLPGEASAIMTTIDGHKMASRGEAGSALFAAAIGSFIAGCIGTLLIATVAGPLTQLAFEFGPVEYFSLMLLGLVGAITFSKDSLFNALSMTVVGMLLGSVGTDINSGMVRFGLGIHELADGLGFVVVAMGLFGYAEIIYNLSINAAKAALVSAKSRLMPTSTEVRQMSPAIARGTVIGSILGILPGAGVILSPFVSYAVEKKLRTGPGEIPVGEGNIRGVAGPESANNASAQTSFIPLLSLGLPSNAVLAMLSGAMVIHGIQPGPQVMTSSPDLFWGLIASMWIGNLILVVLNLPLVSIWARLMNIPYSWLFPAIMLFCAIGVFTIASSVVDVWLMGVFGVIGYFLKKANLDAAPLLLGFLLGPQLEEYLRRALIMSQGSYLTLFSSGISIALLSIAVLLLIVAILSRLKK